MIYNIEIGECYYFTLRDKTIYKGKVEFYDNGIISIWNPIMGEKEIKDIDVELIEPAIC